MCLKRRIQWSKAAFCLTKERFQFIHVLFPATLDTCAGHRRPVVPSPLTGFGGGKEEQPIHLWKEE